jgi:hypothetical protein
MVQQACIYENLNPWTCGTISQRNWLLEEAWISLHWSWAFNFDDVHIIPCGGFSQSLSPAEDHPSSWCCSLSTHLQFRFLSFSSSILGLRTINKLPIYAKPQTRKRISIQRQNFTSIYSVLVYARMLFSRKCHQWQCSSWVCENVMQCQMLWTNTYKKWFKDFLSRTEWQSADLVQIMVFALKGVINSERLVPM